MGALKRAILSLPGTHYPKRNTHAGLTSCLPIQSAWLTNSRRQITGPHTYAQLFHVAPGVEPQIISSRKVRLRSGDGKACMIEEFGDEGRWSIITGQDKPFVQGWYSCEFGKMEPSPTLYFTTPKPARSYRFETRITLHDEQ